MPQLSHHALADGRRIAFHHTRGAGPTLVFLPGYMSDMSGSKASALAQWAAREGRGCLLFDYSGCGESGGDFAQGTLSRWREEALSLIAAEITGNIVLVGSSMGGWLMLLLAEALGGQVAGMVGIAPAPDFIAWGIDAGDRRRLEVGETVFAPNPYGPEPTPTHARFFADSGQWLRLDGPIAIDCPVHLLHGQRDEDVPWDISIRLAARLRSDAVKVTLVKDGDHRLSRPQDIALLCEALARCTEVH